MTPMIRAKNYAVVFALLLAGFVVMSPSAALADCSVPAGVEGELIYNADHNAVQFCDGTNWIKMGSSEAQDDRIGTLTNGKWCSSDGSTIDCTQDPPAAAAAGSDTQVIFNDGGSTLAGAVNLLWDKTFNSNAGGLTIGANTAPNYTVDVTGKAAASAVKLKPVSGAAAPGGVSGVGGSAGQVQFNDGSGLEGDAALVWDNTNKRLGIGTSSPSGQLHVSGGTIVVDNVAVPLIFNESDVAANTPGKYWRMPVDGTILRFDVDTQGDGDFVPYVTALSMNASGNIGIGTTLTPAQLSIVGAGNAPLSGSSHLYGMYIYRDTGAGTGYIDVLTNSTNNTNLALRTYNAGTYNTVFYGQASGNVGIGTTSPGSKLHVAGPSPILTIQNTAYTTASNALASWITFKDSGGSEYGWVGNGSTSNNDMTLRSTVGSSVLSTTGGSLTLDTSGRVGIGAVSTGPTLHVAGTIGATSWIGAGCEAACEVSGGYSIMYGNGQVVITGPAYKPGGGSWIDSSDVRLKTNIQPITGALDKISLLQGVDFDWRKPELHKNNPQAGGFIAQDVAKVFPEFILDNDCTEDECELVSGGKVKTLSLPFKFDAYIVEAIKELKGLFGGMDDRVKMLEAENAALKARLDALEAKQ